MLKDAGQGGGLEMWGRRYALACLNMNIELSPRILATTTRRSYNPRNLTITVPSETNPCQSELPYGSAFA